MQGAALCHFNSFIQNKFHGMMSKLKYFEEVLYKNILTMIKKTPYSKQRKSFSKAWASGFSLWDTVVNSVSQQFKLEIEVA